MLVVNFKNNCMLTFTLNKLANFLISDKINWASLMFSRRVSQYRLQVRTESAARPRRLQRGADWASDRCDHSDASAAQPTVKTVATQWKFQYSRALYLPLPMNSATHKRRPRGGTELYEYVRTDNEWSKHVKKATLEEKQYTRKS